MQLPSTCGTASTTAAASPRPCATTGPISTPISAPAFGEQPLESITPERIRSWRDSLPDLSNRTKNKLLVVLGGVMGRAQHVWGLPSSPVASVEKHRARSSGGIDVFSPEEVMALVRGASS